MSGNQLIDSCAVILEKAPNPQSESLALFLAELEEEVALLLIHKLIYCSLNYELALFDEIRVVVEVRLPD